uniref:Uncharacterized protein n=1 Tax=Anguilla anguilla TaxID=7936 RepID=A0A0E9T979_ANGAN
MLYAQYGIFIFCFPIHSKEFNFRTEILFPE